MRKKILLSILLVLAASIATVNIMAATCADNCMNDCGDDALCMTLCTGTCFGNSGSSTSLGTKLETFLKGNIKNIILLVGNLVFAAVTLILGVKYIWSSADGKAEVMETLPNFVFAVIFFYLGETLVNWLMSGSGSLNSTISVANNWTGIANPIIGTINTIVSMLAFGGILYLGLKYMFASAEGKAQLKTNSGALLIGIMFVFMASKVVDYIIDIGEQIL